MSAKRKRSTSASEKNEERSDPEQLEKDQSGTSTTAVEGVGVNFPFFFKNLDTAIKTVGGEESLSSNLQSQSRFLELRFRPGDTFCHPVFADRVKTNCVLLKVRRRKRPLPPSTSDTLPVPNPRQREEDHATAEVVAAVPWTYKFKGMADYQYVTGSSAATAPKSYDVDLDKVFSSRAAEAEPMTLLPPIFSKTDTPQPYYFRPNYLHKRESSARKAEQDGETEGSKQRPLFQDQEASSGIVIVDYQQGGKLPTIEDKPAPTVKFDADELALIEELNQKFNERPVWLRSRLEAGLSPHLRKYLKATIPQVAFVFSNGPWRLLLVRYGYDPRINRESRSLQVIDVRTPYGVDRPMAESSAKIGGASSSQADNNGAVAFVGPLFSSQNLSAAAAVGRSKRKSALVTYDVASYCPEFESKDLPQLSRPKSYAKWAPHRKPAERQREEEKGGEDNLTESQQIVSTGYTDEALEGASLVLTFAEDKEIYVFNQPLRKQNLYQICDVADSDIQALVAELAVPDSCNEAGGWFPKEAIALFRLILKLKFALLLGPRQNLKDLEMQRQIGQAIFARKDLLSGALTRRSSPSPAKARRRSKIDQDVEEGNIDILERSRMLDHNVLQGRSTVTIRTEEKTGRGDADRKPLLTTNINASSDEEGQPDGQDRDDDNEEFDDGSDEGDGEEDDIADDDDEDDMDELLEPEFV